LSSNPIRAIPAPSAAELAGERLFPSLKHISLIDVPLARWSDLEALDLWLRSGPAEDTGGSASPADAHGRGGLSSLALGGTLCPLASSESPESSDRQTSSAPRKADPD